ncbi:MAG: sulfate adenylyltransferase subunit CysD [Candidatus Nanopelagicales bacterium]|nr:sulfate adenylyltransferase subunit CysD [Candidatus Nanopelagicales bacterium]MDP4715763.1 sulfate adenylyltransferase subunit CysD [Candidatus Nanopelagicales bacterium]MDP4906196.1 sulfate adenylyltransferase subunit CysD [Candidatus Nanopelagicales bacterium]MDP4975011.1 sulfate adenylyltransferase subunit CysD [Candidatus Nanopelagicales bacterium]
MTSAAPAPVSDDDVLDALEAEAMHVYREVAGAFRRPVLLYSIGKDSSVLLHLARKAFAPAPIPFKVMHIDTTWKFKEMIEFRTRMVEELNLDLKVQTNLEAVAEGITPFTHGAHEYTRIMKTVALRQGLDELQADCAIGGARRDEEKSRAKERIFSLREPGHRWDPRKQRPEFWRTANTMLAEGQTMRAFPISNWTEFDIWRYIRRENIPIVDLYFGRPRPVVQREGTWIMVDDDRLPLREGEEPQMRSVRFRTLGCYPLSGAVESTATDLDTLIAEMLESNVSERAGRLIDGEGSGSMEAKKAEGYF